MATTQKSISKKLVRVARGNYYRAIYRAQDSGLLPSHTDYTRFICMASSRTGSTLLIRSLAQHPDVRIFAEIVRNYDLFPAYDHRFAGSENLYRTDPASFLEERVFRKYPASVGAVGFKILYRHAPREEPWGSQVWDYLLGLPQLNIIHLKRRNLLRVYVSKTIANDTSEWIKYSAASAQGGKLTVDLDDLVAFCTWRRGAENDFDTLFARNPLLQMTYEDFIGDFANQMVRVQEFLGLTPVEMPQAIEKRPSKPLSDQIANYDELVERLTGTEWADFLEDDRR